MGDAVYKGEPIGHVAQGVLGSPQLSTTEKPPVDPDDPQLENGLCQTSSVFGPAEAQPDTSYPEGGRAATVVLGSFCALAGGLGLMNSMGVYAAWIGSHQLAATASPGRVAWIFGLYNFAVFFCGLQVGPVFDARGPRGLLARRAAALRRRLCRPRLLPRVLALCPRRRPRGRRRNLDLSLSCPSRRLASITAGDAPRPRDSPSRAGSLGGVVFPLLFTRLCERLGFAWATRVIGAVTVVLLLVGCVTVRRRDVFADAPGTAGRSLLPDLRVLLRVSVLLMTAGVFFIEWGFFIGLEYVASYALAHGAGRKLSNLMIVFLNAGSVFGRWLAGIMADRFGRLNTMILTNLLCITAMFAIWLPARDSVAAIILFSVVFGFASGSNVSLVPVCVGEYCTTDNYGCYDTTVYTVVSFGALTGVPIAGPILQSSGGSYTGLVIFAGAAYVAGTACFSAIWVINRVRYQDGKA
ncbi:hypothetical protein G3M48_006557 [Beauveria asiatica]|uniref:Major facilitator superfamily (MFS) profile domain-containing protein n=1 Tax=Beauveria asiatica TaxID=1069075 RepID=A0AAW0RPC2_9HYPO